MPKKMKKFMLAIKPLRQKPGACGPVCLKMVLEYYGIKKSVKTLEILSGATHTRGVEAAGLIRAARKIGKMGFLKDFSSIQDLRYYVVKKKIPVIVDWFSEDDGHYSVVVGIDRVNIYLQDPEFGHMRRIKIKTFQRVWFDFPGDFLRSKKDIFIRRSIIIV